MLFFFIEINGCKPDPCKFGACMGTGPGEFRCHCLPGYTGTLCDEGKTEIIFHKISTLPL